MNSYFLYGLTISTPFLCPELLPSSSAPDVVVRYGNIEDSSIIWSKQGVCYKATKDDYLLTVNGVARYLLSSGMKITIEKQPNVDEDSLRLFLYNEVFAALLMQRGMLVLKASVVARDGKAYVLLGSTSMGKSITAAGLGGRGYSILADGVCAIDENSCVSPGLPVLMLWEKGLQEIGENPKNFKPVRKGMNKFFFPVKQNYIDQSLPVAGIILLSEHNKNEIIAKAIEGADKFFVILRHGYHPELALPMGEIEQVNKLVAITATQSKMRRIEFNMSANPFDNYIEFIGKELAFQPNHQDVSARKTANTSVPSEFIKPPDEQAGLAQL